MAHAAPTQATAAIPAVRRPLPPARPPAEVADPGLIRIGAAVGRPPRRG